MKRDPAGSKWTTIELKAIKKDWVNDTLSDGDGLFGTVRLNLNNSISIEWRYAFRFDGKVCWHYCGRYPKETMANIRNIRDKAKASVKNGIDPRVKKVTDKLDAQTVLRKKIADDKQRIVDEQAEIAKNLSFGDTFKAWIKDGIARADGNAMVTRTFNNHALPLLANIPLRELSKNDLLDLFRGLIAKGKIRTCVMLYKDIVQMLAWAELEQPYRALLINGNPSKLIDIEKLLPVDYQEQRTRILSFDEIRKLRNIFIESSTAYKTAPNKYQVTRPLKKESQLALWICLGTLSRIGELLLTEWKHLDFDAKTWFIPRENVKGNRKTKSDLLIYLSDFALDKFKQLHNLTGDYKYAFPSANGKTHVCLKSVSKQVGDRQTQFKQRTKALSKRVNDNSLVLGDSDWTPQDLRRTGSTMMQQLKISREIINLCQNHSVGSKVDKHYLHYNHADEMRDAWLRLGDRLDAVLAGDNVVNLRRA